MTPAPRILVVDDEPALRDMLAEMLEIEGYDIVCAASGADALVIAEAKPGVQLVISDVRMPGISGLELAARLAEIAEPPKVILISGYFQSQAVQSRFLMKPFTLAELSAAVADELSGSGRAPA